jgi:hypothetical protein
MFATPLTFVVLIFFEAVRETGEYSRLIGQLYLWKQYSATIKFVSKPNFLGRSSYKYQYVIDGKKYTGKRTDFSSKFAFSFRSKNLHFQKGDTIPIYVSPRLKTQATITTEINVFSIFCIWGLFFLSILGLVFFIQST